ncbi:MAG: YeeE/YedE thiosulfate transporter family protein [Deferrisomatales bacterium]|nr:YeeE/YedE thiosulfate transporter family protein [Deferrisomatales bacterium]
MTQVWLGLLSGIAFGFVIQRAGATDANEMARAHLLLDGRVPRFMVAAVALGALGLLGLQSVGLGHTLVLPTSLVATGLGAVIFGVGWGLSGYCPGTCWAAVGEGRMDAVFALLGGFAGAATFAQFHEPLVAHLYLPTSLGSLTLSHWLRPDALAVGVLAAAFLGCAWLMGRVWGRGDASS